MSHIRITNPNSQFYAVKRLLLVLGVAVLCGTSAFSQSYRANWVGGTGSWYDANNWLCGNVGISTGTPCVPNGSTDVVISNGGTVLAIGGSLSAGSISLLNFGGGSLIVEGGASGTSAGITIGSSCYVCGASMLNLLNPGTTWTNNGDLFVGGDFTGGELNVIDSARLTTSGQLVVGDEGVGTLTIEGGGVVMDNSGEIQFTYNSESTGVAQVVGSGSSWISATTLNIGGAGSADLTVQDGGTVSAQTITISELGTVVADGGTLQGTVINHGTLDPVGTITIIGDYTQGVDGTLILDVAGTGTGDFGQLDVSGNATLDGTIDLDFINGFAPSQGDMFDFINVGGSADFSGATFDISGLLPGFEYTNSFQNGQFILTALNDGTSASPTPEPGTFLLMGTALLGLLAFGRRMESSRAR